LAKKAGRNKKKCEQYKLSHRREKNKEAKKLRYEMKMEKAKQRKLKRQAAKAETPVSKETIDAKEQLAPA